MDPIYVFRHIWTEREREKQMKAQRSSASDRPEAVPYKTAGAEVNLRTRNPKASFSSFQNGLNLKPPEANIGA